MTREERLKELARLADIIITKERRIKKDKEEVRAEIFRLVSRGFENQDHILPVRTIEVPASFWEDTGMTLQEFTDSRFPGWDVEHVEKNIADGNTVFILKKNADFMPDVIELENANGTTTKVSKTISEYSPEIDWESLTSEFPEIAVRLGRAKITIELDEKELEQLLEEEPDILSKLQRHLKTKEPSKKLSARRVENG